MILYSKTKKDFIADVTKKEVSQILQDQIIKLIGEAPDISEIHSWEHSLVFMRDVLDTTSIPDDTGIVLEYNIPVTNKRIDIMVTGKDKTDKNHAILIELKQWSKGNVKTTEKDAIVNVNFGKKIEEKLHPSYQISSYASILENFNAVIQSQTVILHPCVFLHNYVDDGVISDRQKFNDYIKDAPIFYKGEEEKLRGFILAHIQKGDQGKTIDMIENSEIVPSKQLSQNIFNMYDGAEVFHMIEDQKIIFENCLSAFKKFQESGKKQVIIVKGGPGTGKSVVAMNLLMQMLIPGYSASYNTKNKSLRSIYQKNLLDNGLDKNTVERLIQYSGSYNNCKCNQLDMLLADEAHRLMKDSRGSQIAQIINASKVSVFFLDEHQRVTLDDIGSAKEIDRIAENYGEKCQREDYKLTSQFRCTGGDEFINWADHLLQYDGYSPITFGNSNYDLRSYDNPQMMMDEIIKLDKEGLSRVVAGFCWKWKKDNENGHIILEGGFNRKWNLHEDQTWAITEGSVEQIGCIHTCQGMEFNYVGVIIGNDLIYRDGKIIAIPDKNQTFIGQEGERDKDGQVITIELLTELIKNTYRTLMTRGMKGCFIYACDKNLREYIKKYLPKSMQY